MSPIVRGNKLVVVDTPPPCTAQKTPTKDKWGISSHPKIGDHLWVASRKKNGWIRVKNARTELVTSLRVGPWVEKEAVDSRRKPVTQPSNGVVALVAAASSMEPLVVQPPTSSSMDQLIRKSQVDALEAALEAKDKEIADLEKKRSALEYVGRRDAEAYHERVHELEEHYQSELGRVRDLLTEQQERNNELLKLVDDHLRCRMIDRETITILNDTNAELKAQLKQLLEGGHEEEGFVLPDELDQ
tara:strand:+ start:825 stop:1556 length:732 start_codon:yes stop_codon:yes gene_type:complete